MNYIKRLQVQVRALQAEKLAYRNGLNEIRAYLSSPKFSSGNELDGYVNVNDVLNRIQDVFSNAAGEEVSYGAIYKFLAKPVKEAGDPSVENLKKLFNLNSAFSKE